MTIGSTASHIALNFNFYAELKDVKENDGIYYVWKV